jgi:thioredoxin reductase (NADPH)
MTTYDLAVIGEGIAGLSCARRAAELGFSAATFENNLFGGLVVNVGALQGYGEGKPGVELAAELAEANNVLGVDSIGAGVVSFAHDGAHIVLTTDIGVMRARSVVLATGARMKELGVPGEADFEHRGVSHCADCDGPMMKGQPVVVAGGGDSAFMQAAVLAEYASEVTLLLRSKAPRARPELLETVTANSRIRILPQTSVLEISGSDGVSSVRVGTPGKEQIIPCSGLFIYVGLQPNADLVAGRASQAADGAVLTDDQFLTSLPGVYAIGAVRSGYSGRLVDAVREATSAAEHAVARPRS